MELGWPLPKRKQHIKELTAQPIERTHPVRFQGKQQYLPVRVVPLGMPLYRLENGRTVGRQAEYLVKHPELPADFFRIDSESVEAQRAQHEILVKLAREKKDLFREFEKEPQSDPIILTHNGYVVNGNRRLSTWRSLFESNKAKFSSFGNIDAIILPYSDDRDVDQLEADYQLKEELKLEYSWTSTALMMREKMLVNKYSQDDLAAIYDMDKKQVIELLDCLDYAEQYLESRNKSQLYSEVDGKEYAFIQISRSRKKLKADTVGRDIFERASFCLADEAGEGKRIYSEIPKIADHLNDVVASVAKELDIPGSSEEETRNNVASALDDEANFEQARLVIRDSIEAASQHHKHQKKKEYVALLVKKARDNLKTAKESIDKQSSRSGVVESIDEIASLAANIREWAVDAK